LCQCYVTVVVVGGGGWCVLGICGVDVRGTRDIARMIVNAAVRSKATGDAFDLRLKAADARVAERLREEEAKWGAAEAQRREKVCVLCVPLLVCVFVYSRVCLQWVHLRASNMWRPCCAVALGAGSCGGGRECRGRNRDRGAETAV
jgi:hypothetical protein